MKFVDHLMSVHLEKEGMGAKSNIQISDVQVLECKTLQPIYLISNSEL